MLGGMSENFALFGMAVCCAKPALRDYVNFGQPRTFMGQVSVRY